MKQGVIDKVKALAEEIAADNGVELVNVELLGSGSRKILRVTIDKDGGIGLLDCQTVSRDLEALLDVEDPIPGRYTLEVTSPGIDRPLKTLDDFVRFSGKKARVVTKEGIDEQTFFVGLIEKVEGTDIILKLPKRDITIPFEQIKSARLEIEI